MIIGTVLQIIRLIVIIFLQYYLIKNNFKVFELMMKS